MPLALLLVTAEPPLVLLVDRLRLFHVWREGALQLGQAALLPCVAEDVRKLIEHLRRDLAKGVVDPLQHHLDVGTLCGLVRCGVRRSSIRRPEFILRRRWRRRTLGFGRLVAISARCRLLSLAGAI